MSADCDIASGENVNCCDGKLSVAGCHEEILCLPRRPQKISGKRNFTVRVSALSYLLFAVVCIIIIIIIIIITTILILVVFAVVVISSSSSGAARLTMIMIISLFC